MANEEHLAIFRLVLLGENVEIWKDWRKENPDLI